ncbi:ribosomal-protein-alanine N-acetyltransferase [Halomonas sp. THAF5a]|uniref:ribosomal protein S18-alanine N-acetyltransferase n=1 Tax=Halomonas sp. THAF5a TaxID=2587844 RepID=UPI001267EB92|nr:ribosomal protein S18-alanine N-acetyltransferase [Halomonas sp. THAF5a]QFU00378.1 ribosomal-protein-alanine N-acetyltransferase [Halomonas sp. THAF5a]
MPPAEATLRPLGSGDLAALTALEQAGQAHPWTPRQLAAALNDPETRVIGAAWNARLVGHAVVVRLPFEAELQAILVAGDQRRQGVAARLLDAVIEAAKGWDVERLLLEVRASNAPAIGLYRRAGFHEDGRRRGYYPPLAGREREDALLMSLSLG